MHEGEAVAPRPPYLRNCLHNPAFPLSMNGKPRGPPAQDPKGQAGLRHRLPPQHHRLQRERQAAAEDSITRRDTLAISPSER